MRSAISDAPLFAIPPTGALVSNDYRRCRRPGGNFCTSPMDLFMCMCRCAEARSANHHR